MALPPNSELRGVAAAIHQPAADEDLSVLMDFITALTHYNRQGPRIEYRNSVYNQDIVEAVYRWDTRSPREIFRTGFLPREQGSTSNEDYYNLERHVNSGGASADNSRVLVSAFVSTTRSTSWRLSNITNDCILYRYEMYPPGGIDTVLTLRDHNRYANQQEISFVGAIRPQYIRSARPYSVVVPNVPGRRFPRYHPYGNRIYRNGYFNPNPTTNVQTTTEEFMNLLRNPTCPRRDQFLLNFCFFRPSRQKREVVEGTLEEPYVDEDTPLDEEPYIDPACCVGHYIECAFNFSDSKEAYLFTVDQCVQINYAPGTTNDYIVKGPMSIEDCFPYLRDTIFATGIDAAFTSCRKNEVYIFRSNIYALINFVESGGHIIQGPKKITDSFYSLKNTIFENGIDAAFASHRKNEAYIFKGDQYALINYAPGTTDDYIIQGPKKITLSFPSLKGTIFQNGLDGAFSATAENEAYIFKGDIYALIDYAPGSTNDRIINGPITPISDGFHSLRGIIPAYPCGCS